MESEPISQIRCRCGADAAPGCKRCSRCLERARTTNTRRAARFAGAGRCPKCGTAPPPGRKLCARCLEKDRSREAEQRRERSAAGLCGRCGAAPEPGKKVCGSCLAWTRERVERRAAAGLCPHCGKAPREATGFCRPCWFKRAAGKYLGSARHAEALAALWDAQGGRCALSGVELVPGVNASVDHVVHQSRNGKAEISNLRWLDLSTNRARNALTDAEFVAMCRRVVAVADSTS